MPEQLYGKNSVRECLRAGRRQFYNLVLAGKLENSAVVNEIYSLAHKHQVHIDKEWRKKMDAKTNNNQGVMLEVSGYPTVEVEDILNYAEETGEPPFLIALDHIEDPHNLGAIIRTAELVGAHGVILPNQRQADITPTVVKASAGATEHMRIAKISNLAQTLNSLKKTGIWAVGMQPTPDSKPFHEADLKGPIVLVIGSEGTGMSRLVKETCDFLIEIPMRGKVDSLNASVASALVMYETWRARGFEGRQKN